MSEVYCKEKLSNQETKDYVHELAKKYEIEKLFDRNKIIIKKESEFTTVRRIINEYKTRSVAEFDTIFKLYKLQKYIIDETYFKGTQYRLHTLNLLKALVKSITIDDSICYYNNYKNIIRDFIKEVKQVSLPFSAQYFDNKRLQISDLLNCGSLTTEEIDFIKSEIHPTHIRTKKNIQQNSVSTINDNYKKLVENRDLSVAQLHDLIPSLSKKSLSIYKGYLRILDKYNGTIIPKSCSSGLVTAWKKFVINPNTLGTYPKIKNTLTRSKQKRASGNRYHFTDIDLYNLINNMEDTETVYKLIPKASKKSIGNYLCWLRQYKTTGQKPDAMPTRLAEFYKANKVESLKDSIVLPITNEVSITDSSNVTIQNEDKIKTISEQKQSKFVLLQNGIPIASSDSEEYIKGYKDAIINSFRIYSNSVS